MTRTKPRTPTDTVFSDTVFSDTVFRDIGFNAGDSASLRIRSELMIRISQIIERRGLTQTAAAQLLGVTQPRISDLVRGKIDLFSIDTLVDMIFRTGGSVSVVVKGARKTA